MFIMRENKATTAICRVKVYDYSFHENIVELQTWRLKGNARKMGLICNKFNCVKVAARTNITASKRAWKQTLTRMRRLCNMLLRSNSKLKCKC